MRLQPPWPKRRGSGAHEREGCTIRPCIAKGLFAVLLTATLSGSLSASPLGSKLLSLVPPGAEVVSGFENYQNTNAHGRLLLTTHNNRVDLDDWQAITGVDNKRVFREFIEVAASFASDALIEHLLLVSGSFDRGRIFTSAERNGAQRIDYNGEPILLIKPFARERGDMEDLRWLAILDNRTGLLGTPELVRQGLKRYANHAVPDPVLQERLTQLRSDVTSWNVLTSMPKPAKSISFQQTHGAWASLQEGSDVMLLAVRFGTRIRVDFALHAEPQSDPAFFHRKAAFFTAALGESIPSGSSSQELEHRLQNFAVAPDRVQGSIELSDKQFADWCMEVSRIQYRPPQPAAGN